METVRNFYTEYQIEISFCLLLILSLFRMMGLLKFALIFRVAVFFIVFGLFFFFRKVILPKLFNSVYFQGLLYALFFLENFF